MGTAELWTADHSLYKFTESTSMDPNQGQIILEPYELRRRMIHVKHTVSPNPNQPDTSTIIKDYAAMKPKAIDTTRPEDYARQMYYALMVSALCNNSSIRDEEGEMKAVGDPTEIALTVATLKAKLDRAYWIDQLGFKKIFERAFDSERKLMSAAYTQATDKQAMVVCKGAPEELLQKCNYYMSTTEQGPKDLLMTDEFASQVQDENVRMASQGLRVLGLAYKTIPCESLRDEEDENLMESDLVFIGLVGLIDPPKQGVKEAVDTCQQAGIHVVMITGDHIETATAIASQLGIIKNHIPRMVITIIIKKKKNNACFPFRIVLSLDVNWICFQMMLS
jgi:Ca2+-transporting ATPase